MQQLGAGPNQWLRIDETRINDQSNLPFDLTGAGDALGIAES